MLGKYLKNLMELKMEIIKIKRDSFYKNDSKS